MGSDIGQFKICAVLPAYNECKTIGKIIQETKRYVGTIIVVDDCSTDITGEIARQNGAEVIRHTTNEGIGIALQTGYNSALRYNPDFIVQLDSDGQHDPKYIPQMFDAIQHCDVVIGSRFLNQSHRQYPVVRRAGILFFTFMVNLLTGTKVSDVTSGYRMFRTPVVRKLSPILGHYWAEGQTAELGRRGYKIKEISVEMPVRNTGKSQFTFYRYVVYPFNTFLIILKMSLFKNYS